MRAHTLTITTLVAKAALVATSNVAFGQPAAPPAPQAAPQPAPASTPDPATAPEPAEATPEPTPVAAPETAAPAPAGPPAPASADPNTPNATDAPVHVAPAPSPPSSPEPSRVAIGGPEVSVENWQREAPASEPEPRVYRGFSIRLSAQLGLATASRDFDEERTRTSGLSGGVMLDVGTTVSDNWIVYNRVGGFALNHASSSDTPNAGSAYFGLLGVGARHHFMPFDWYGSATLALAVASITSDLGVVENAKPGIGVQLETGKNWGTGPDARSTTVGVGARFSYVRCGSLRDIDEPWIGTALSLVFSLAYN